MEPNVAAATPVEAGEGAKRRRSDSGSGDVKQPKPSEDLLAAVLYEESDGEGSGAEAAPPPAKKAADMPAAVFAALTGGKRAPKPPITLKRHGQSAANAASPAAAPARPASPAKNPVSATVRVDGFVRPCKVDDIKALMESHGTLTADGLWVDALRSHCFATFESTVAAVNCRNAVHGLVFQPFARKALSADFSAETAQEVAQRAPAAKPAWVPPPEPRRAPKPPSPTPQSRKAITIDDLFSKTTTEPPLYYLLKSDADAAAARARVTEGGGPVAVPIHQLIAYRKPLRTRPAPRVDGERGGGRHSRPRYPKRQRHALVPTLKDLSASDVSDSDGSSGRNHRARTRTAALAASAPADNKRWRREVSAHEDGANVAVIEGVRITRHGVHPVYPLSAFVPDDQVGRKQHSTRASRAGTGGHGATSTPAPAQSAVPHTRTRSRGTALTVPSTSEGSGSSDDGSEPTPAARVTRSRARTASHTPESTRTASREGSARSDGDSESGSGKESGADGDNSGSGGSSDDDGGGASESGDGGRYNLRTQRDPVNPYNYSPRLERSPSAPRIRRAQPNGRSGGEGRRRRRGMFSSSDSDDSNRRKLHTHKQPSDLPMPINMPGVTVRAPSAAKARADVDPVGVDPSVGWADVGGLETQVEAVKEMVLLPLLYPEVFERFRFTPPRGVLFHGPPGTGKTLVARALANACTADGQRVAFFMRKGADCLSKWVGEAERQLRLLFDQARAMQPAVIFFDEIDGLAPVRSAKADQVVVIGATNRLDAIDPALRRPGRFDRELAFSLPNRDARRAILDIHCRHWSPSLSPHFKDALAAATAGYCGADIRALCTEAALRAVRRRYPQVYASTRKLKVDPAAIRVTLGDFVDAFNGLTPASHRSATVLYRSLPLDVEPLLRRQLKEALTRLTELFPVFPLVRRAATVEADPGYDSDEPSTFAAVYGRANSDTCASCGKRGELVCCDSCPAAYHTACVSASHAQPVVGSDAEWQCERCVGGVDGSTEVAAPARRAGVNGPPVSYFASVAAAARQGVAGMCERPRLLVCGGGDSGAEALGEAMLHALEEVPMFSLDMATLIGDPLTKTAVESLLRRVSEARKCTPCVLYLPRAAAWWDTADATLRACLAEAVSALPPSLPLLLLAVSDRPRDHLDAEFLELFDGGDSNVLAACGLGGPSPVFPIAPPDTPARREFVTALLHNVSLAPFAGPSASVVLASAATGDSEQDVENRVRAVLQAQARAQQKQQLRSREELEPAEPPRRTGPTPADIAQRKREQALQVTLRNMLRGILDELRKNRRLLTFDKPVDPEEVPDYYVIVTRPMDFSTMMDKIEDGRYLCYEEFLADILLVQHNAREYNPRHDPASHKILQDAARIPDLVEEMAAGIDERLGGVIDACRQLYRDRHGHDPDARALLNAVLADGGADRGHARVDQKPPGTVAVTDGDSGGRRLTRTAARQRGETVVVFPDVIDVIDGRGARSGKRGSRQRSASGAGDSGGHSSGSTVESDASEGPSDVGHAGAGTEASEGALRDESAAPAPVVTSTAVVTTSGAGPEDHTLLHDVAAFHSLHTQLHGYCDALTECTEGWPAGQLLSLRTAVTRRLALLSDKSPRVVAAVVKDVVTALVAAARRGLGAVSASGGTGSV